MRLEESLEFFARQIERAEKGLLAAVSGENIQLAALNVRQLFKNNLMVGLMKWRCAEDARPDFNAAVNAVLEGAAFLKQKNSSFDLLLNLPVERASIIAYLLNREFNISHRDGSLDAADRQLDWEVASVLNGANGANGANGDMYTSSYLEKLKKNKSSKLAVKTYEVYFEILDLGLSGKDVTSMVEVAGELFMLRSKDVFYSGSDQTEGGGHDNNLVVDYRLASILKRVGFSGVSPHFWLWD